MGNKNKIGFWKQLSKRYKLSFFNENTLEEVWTVRFNSIGAILLVTLIVGLIVLLALSFILGTPAKTLLPGYLANEDRNRMVDNTLRIDSLTRQMQLREQYLANIEAILTGNITIDSIAPDTLAPTDTTTRWDPHILTKASPQSEAFATAYEQEERFMLNTLPTHEEGILFYPPLRGHITQHYDPKAGNYGIHITASRRAAISATLDGTIVAVTYSVEQGYVIVIQHNNNYMSIYRNNAQVLRNPGDPVAAGERIAIIGITGEVGNTSTAIFELWHAGKSINPEDVIAF